MYFHKYSKSVWLVGKHHHTLKYIKYQYIYEDKGRSVVYS